MDLLRPRDHRLIALRASLSDELPSLIVTLPINIGYLLDYPDLFAPDFSGPLLVTRSDAQLMVDSRYTAQANAAELPVRVVEWRESPWQSLQTIVAEAEVKKCGFESSVMSVAQYNQVKKVMGVELTPTEGLVEALRLKKEPAEIDALTKAARLGDQVFLKILEKLRPGLAELEVAAEIDYMLRQSGAEGSSFETIVASGPNSAFPHARAGARRLESGDFIKMDFGGVYGGYHADMTRTVVLGPLTEERRQLYEDVAKAQELVLLSLAPGVTGREMDAISREYFQSIGKADHFSHNLGHGVGLDVHEQPTLGPKSTSTLEPGMVFTVEPGLYFPKYGGVRIEDMVLMCEHGIQVLTESTKELLVL